MSSSNPYNNSSPYTIKVIRTLKDITAQEWDACALNAENGFNPFISHAFISALEDSGCATAQTGWLGQHILLENKQGRIDGIMPLYLKNNSFGEYVFDHAWANAYQQAGGHYYPKLQSSVPFSPITTPKLLSHPKAHHSIPQELAKAAILLAQKHGVSSLHVTFSPEEEWQLLAECGFLRRQDQQFHWINQNYRNFEAFLDELSSRKRKNIRKERLKALEGGISIEVLTGSEITEDHWDHYYDFYLDTSNRKWGQAYLNREFFSLIGERLKDNIVLILCKRAGRYMAGALNIKNRDILYGRYWGTVEDHPFLHFEVCYYQAIDYAIRHGLKKVEAGAQGEHKLARGYRPTTTHSAHWIANPSFRDALEKYLEEERKAAMNDLSFLEGLSPFKLKD